MNEDKGVKYTEAQLKAVENKFKQIYKEAQKDVEKKLNEYLAKFKEQDDKKREQLNNGQITETQYKQWRKNKIMTGKRWKEMRDKLADDYTHANIRAINALNGALPQVFAENVNYSTYNIEQLSGLNTSFTLYNQDTVNRLVLDNPDILPKPSVDIPKDQLWNRQHIQSAILQGVLQGESMTKVAKRLQQVSAMNNTAAQRSARTAMTGAQNGGRVEGYKRAESLGIKMLQEWVATYDSRTRHSHAILDGERRKVGEKFSNGLLYPGDPNGAGSEVYNCRCGLIAQLAGFESDVSERTAPLEKMGVTYEEWKEEHRAKMKKPS